MFEQMKNCVGYIPIYLNCGGGDPGMTPSMFEFLYEVSSSGQRAASSESRDWVHNNVYILLMAHVIACEYCQLLYKDDSSRVDKWIKFQLSGRGQRVICDIMMGLTLSMHGGQHVEMAFLQQYLSTKKLAVFVDEFWSLDRQPATMTLPTFWFDSDTNEYTRLLMRAFRGGICSILNAVSCVTDTTSHISLFLRTTLKNYSASATPFDTTSHISYSFCYLVKPPSFETAQRVLTKCMSDQQDVDHAAYLLNGWWYPLGVMYKKSPSCTLQQLTDSVRDKLLAHGRDSVDIVASLVMSSVLGAISGVPQQLYEEMTRFHSGMIDKMTLGSNDRTGEVDVEQGRLYQRDELVNKHLNLISVNMPSSVIAARAVLQFILTKQLEFDVEASLCPLLIGPHTYERFNSASKGILGECLPLYRMCFDAYNSYGSQWNASWRPIKMTYDVNKMNIDLLNVTSATTSLLSGYCVPCCMRHAEASTYLEMAPYAYDLGVGFIRNDPCSAEDFFIVKRDGTALPGECKDILTVKEPDLCRKLERFQKVFKSKSETKLLVLLLDYGKQELPIVDSDKLVLVRHRSKYKPLDAKNRSLLEFECTYKHIL